MAAFIQALTQGITSDAIWVEIGKAAPFVIIMFIVAIGYRVLRKILKAGSKLKVNV